jgi:very-short-patch-repair endonuclease
VKRASKSQRYPLVLPILRQHDRSACEEYRFHPERKWRFDFAMPHFKVAIEVDGSIWTSGRHTRGSGWVKDTEKLNLACCMGWRMLRFCPQDLEGSAWLETVRAACSPPHS